MKSKKSLIMILFVFVMLFSIKNNVSAFSQEYDLMNYDIYLNVDGSATINEKWYVKISDTNTLFKKIKLDNQKFGEIKNITVKEIGREDIQFNEIHNQMYNVPNNCFYALTNSDGDFEIAWGTEKKDLIENKKYEISYTVTNLVNTYNDCNEFCWKVIGYNHKFDIKKITGTIYIPEGIKSIENLKVWAHGPINGIVRKVNEKQVYFEIDNLFANEILEVRVVTLDNIFVKNSKKISINKLDNIFEEESRYANIANEQRKRDKKIVYVFLIIVILMLIYMIIKMIVNKEYKEQLSKLKENKEKRNNNHEYHKELPEDNMTAGDIAYIYYMKNGNFKEKFGDIISANILKLYLKGYIEIKESKKDIIIDIKRNVNEKEKLERDEEAILNLLIGVSKRNSRSFSIKKFKEYIKNIKRRKMMNIIEFVEYEIENNAVSKKICDLTQKSINEKYEYKKGKYIKSGVLMCIFTLFALTMSQNIIITTVLMLLIIIYVGIKIYNLSIINKIIDRSFPLTQKGMNYLVKIEGLRRYIKDTLPIEKMNIEDVMKLKDYAVVATALGLSKKMIRKLIPELEEENVSSQIFYYNIYRYTINRYYVIKTVDGIVKHLGRLSNNASSPYSSASGDGGGFSTGDAGGARRWRNWC